MTKQTELVEQMAVSLKVINKELGMVAESTKTIIYLLIVNLMLLSAGLVKFLFFSA